MLGITGTYKELRGGFRGSIAKIQAATEESPAEAAEFGANYWRQGVRTDTGSYKASIYVQSHDSSDYAEHVSEARSLNPSIEILPELPKPARKGAAAFGSAAGHAVYNEYGSSTISAKPALQPAIEATRKQFPEITKRRLIL